jgi:hypothetical protein
VQSNRIGVIIQLLAESIGQPRKAPHVHPHCQVLALNVAGRDVLLVGIANHDLALAADALCRAVPLGRAHKVFVHEVDSESGECHIIRDGFMETHVLRGNIAKKLVQYFARKLSIPPHHESNILHES